MDIGNGAWAIVLEVTTLQVLSFKIDLAQVSFDSLVDFDNLAKANVTVREFGERP